MSARAVVSAVLLLLATLRAYAADVPPALSHNPFTRPPSESIRADRSIVENDDGSGPTLALLATMVGPTSGLANVAGQILKPGDEIEGYKLIDVYEEYAIFLRDGRSMKVYVNPKMAEVDD